jgi:hypothetical protein
MNASMATCEALQSSEGWESVSLMKEETQMALGSVILSKPDHLEWR